MPAKGWIEVSDTYCKGCELCISACPQEVMELDMTRLTPRATTPRTPSRMGARGVLFVHWSARTQPSPCTVKLPKQFPPHRGVAPHYALIYSEKPMTRELWKGNEAIAEAAVRAGLEAYFGYPITPQTEILEYLSRRMPELGRAFVQAEAELGAINMVYGAACTGVRVMSTSSSPGVSLMMEGLSYIAGTEVPAVLVNVMRGGPGLGNIAPSQADYNQAVMAAVTAIITTSCWRLPRCRKPST